MTNSGHVSRTLLLSRKHPDMLLVSRGSEGNDDAAAADRDSGHSQLRAFNLSALPSNGSGEGKSPYGYLQGTLLGWGLRNSVGVAEHPATGGIWSVENSVDNLRRHGKDIHADNPGEELNFHGYLNGSGEDQGGNYGYPLCYTIWSTDGFPDLGDLDTGDQFPADQPDENDNVITILSDGECNTEYVPPVLAFQAHTAPLDIKFNEDGTRAYVSFHGSCKSHEPTPKTHSYRPPREPRRPRGLRHLQHLLQGRAARRALQQHGRGQRDPAQPGPLQLPGQLLPARRPSVGLQGPPLVQLRQHGRDLCPGAGLERVRVRRRRGF